MANPTRYTDYDGADGASAADGRTQKTQPKGTDEDGRPAEPIEIPVPKRGDVDDALDRLIAAKPVPQDEPIKYQGDALSE
jgi:hypothetical protein